MKKSKDNTKKGNKKSFAVKPVKNAAEKKPRVEKITESSVMQPKIRLEWEAAEFKYYHKDRYWIAGIFILFVSLASILILAGDLWLGGLFAIACILTILVIYQNAHVKPKKYKMILDEKGVVFRDKLYFYNQLKSFWIINHPEGVLYLEQAKLNFPLTILLGKQASEEVRSFLLRYLPEHPFGGEHVGDKLARFLRL